MNWLKDYGGTEGPLGFPMADRSARALEALLKALPATKEHAYRKAVAGKAPTELNPGERSDVSWISTESVDRSGEVVIARGMNDSQFQANPLVTLGHAYHLPPVGRSLWRKRVRDGERAGIKAKTRYPDQPANWPAGEPWMPDRVFALVQAGLLQGKSIGFLPTRTHFAESKEANQQGWPDGTLVIDEWLLLEYAVCFLPVNQDALVEAVSKGTVEVPADVLAALGIEPPGVKREPASPSFVALAEVETAVARALAQIDLEEIARKAVAEAIDRRRGRV